MGELTLEINQVLLRMNKNLAICATIYIAQEVCLTGNHELQLSYCISVLDTVILLLTKFCGGHSYTST